LRGEMKRRKTVENSPLYTSSEENSPPGIEIKKNPLNFERNSLIHLSRLSVRVL